MDMFTALCHDKTFDPPSFGKAQLEHLSLSYSISVANLAQVYKELGGSYHKLPLHVRGHRLCPTALQKYCSLAFTCSEVREMPDMIQVINMLTEALARARAAILCNEFALAVSRLAVAALLVEEAEHRVAKLSYAMNCYQDLLESLTGLVGVPVLCTASDQSERDDSDGLQQGWMKLQWLNALPKCLQDAEEKTTDSGYSSACGSVIVE